MLAQLAPHHMANFPHNAFDIIVGLDCAILMPNKLMYNLEVLISSEDDHGPTIISIFA